MTTPSNDRRIALITGGSRGLGKDMALALAEAGTDVIITYRSASAEAAAVVQAIEGKGRRAVALQLDTARPETFAAFVETVRAALGETFGAERLYALVNNAGVGNYAPIADTTPAQFEMLMKVHLEGPFFLTQGLLPLIADGGRILNVSTGLTRFSLPGYAAYAMMKGGIEVFTRYLAKELGARGIAVNTLAPGAIETDFGGGTVRDNPHVNAHIASQTALGRVGLPDDIGGITAALLSEGARWVNGQRIEASGGMFL
ncbi:MAG: SDR family oxidoreductase [Deltaproteobacteria bacterium]|nr:SDR family oxidoreductase [Deltaproteobacteria bacterium]